MSLIIFLIGLALCVFAHPKVKNFVMARLFNEAILTPKVVEPEKAEVIRFAGPNLSLLAIGVVLMLLGIILRES